MAKLRGLTGPSHMPGKNANCVRKPRRPLWTWSPISRPGLQPRTKFRSPFAGPIIDPAHRVFSARRLGRAADDGTPDVFAVARSVVGQPNQLAALGRTAMEAWIARRALRRGRRLLGAGLACPHLTEPAPAIAIGADLLAARPSVPIPKFRLVLAASSDANFGIKGTLATLWFQCGFQFEVSCASLRQHLTGTSNSPHWR